MTWLGLRGRGPSTPCPRHVVVVVVVVARRSRTSSSRRANASCESGVVDASAPWSRVGWWSLHRRVVVARRMAIAPTRRAGGEDGREKRNGKKETEKKTYHCQSPVGCVTVPPRLTSRRAQWGVTWAMQVTQWRAASGRAMAVC